MTFYFTVKGKKKKIDKFVERISITYQMKISKSDTTLIPDGNNIFEKVNSKRLGKKIEEFRISVARGMFYSSKGRGVVNED